MADFQKLPKGMAEQLQALQAQLMAAQEELAAEEVTGTAGGGAVKVTLTGDQRCTAVEIASGLLEEGDAEMLQDLIRAALNQALDESRQMAADRLTPLSPFGL